MLYPPKTNRSPFSGDERKSRGVLIPLRKKPCVEMKLAPFLQKHEKSL